MGVFGEFCQKLKINKKYNDVYESHSLVTNPGVVL